MDKNSEESGKTNKLGFPKQRSEEGGSFYRGGGWVGEQPGGAHQRNSQQQRMSPWRSETTNN